MSKDDKKNENKPKPPKPDPLLKVNLLKSKDRKQNE
jgi:hypothetical protein